MSYNEDKHIAYIALDSNLGDRQAALDFACRELDNHPGITVYEISSIIETEPVARVCGDVGAVSDQGKFLNAAACLHTTLSPLELMTTLLEIENALGRERKIHWGPRTLDLDLLLYDDQIIDITNGPTPEFFLKVPHPHLHKRLFVLHPLAQIAPDVVHPVLKKTVRELYTQLAEMQSE